MARLPATALLLAVVAFAIVNTENALHKGGDFTIFLESGRRVLASEPLYAGSGPGNGVIGPPFQGVFFTPAAWLAAHSLPAARLSWYLLNLLSLFLGISAWTTALLGPMAVAVWRIPAVWWAAAAILLPAQTNFEHQNMNALLLAILGLGAHTLRAGRQISGGALVGLATALKAFPGFVLLYLAFRREWRAFFAGVATAVALTCTVLPFYGPSDSLETMRAWLAVNGQGGWPVRAQNQSLYAALMRPPLGVPESIAIGVALGVGAGMLVLGGLIRRRGVSANELALVTLTAVVVSPIAWDHYWVLAYPTVLMFAAQSSGLARLTLSSAVVLLTGLSPLTLGAAGYHLMRTASVSTLAALTMMAVGVAQTAQNKPIDRPGREQ